MPTSTPSITAHTPLVTTTHAWRVTVAAGMAAGFGAGMLLTASLWRHLGLCALGLAVLAVMCITASRAAVAVPATATPRDPART